MPRANNTGVRGLYVDTNGRYRIDLRYQDQKSSRPYRHKEVLPVGTPRRAAVLRAQEVLVQALSGSLHSKPKAHAASTLRLAFDAYLEWVKTNRPKAYRNRQSIARKWCALVNGTRAIDTLTPDLLELYKRLRIEEGARPATINRGLTVVRHMARTAARQGWPWMTRERAQALYDVPLLTEPPGRQRPLTQAELSALVGALRSREDSRYARRVVEAALLTGCRLGEVIGLRWARVGADAIDLSHTKQNRNHQVPITAPLKALLEEAKPDSKGGYVFPSSRGKPYTVEGFSKHFARAAGRAGCPDVTFHDLRRHVGTVLINAGVRLEVVSKLLGHSTVAVTQRSYAHLNTDATRDAAKVLARKVAPALPPRRNVTRNRA